VNLAGEELEEFSSEQVDRDIMDSFVDETKAAKIFEG